MRCAYWGIKLSIDSPASSFFSICKEKRVHNKCRVEQRTMNETWIRRSTPSTTFCTSSTSLWPSRSRLDMSNIPSVLAVSTPPTEWNFVSLSVCLSVCLLSFYLPVPLFCSLSFRRISLKRSSVDSFGSLTCTPALSPVPRLDGQVRMKPKCSFHINSLPVAFYNYMLSWAGYY